MIGWSSEAATAAAAPDAGPRGPICGFPGSNLAVYEGLPARFWNTRRPRYCPSCLVGRGYWGAEWGLNLVVACPVHRVRLVDTCYQCKLPLRWSRSSLTECRCGADLGSAQTVAAAPSIIDACADLVATASRDWKMEAGSHVGALADRLHRLWLLGAYVVGSGSKPMKLSKLHAVEHSAKVVEAAAAILSDWPAGFHRLLDEIARRHGHTDPTRLAEAFGSIYTEIFSPAHRSAFAPLRQAFELYISKHWSGQITRRNRRLPCEAVAAHNWLPATRAAEELGWRTPRVRRAISCGLLQGHVRQLPSGRTSAVVHRESLEVFKRNVAEMVTQIDVCRMLHVGKKKVRSMVKAGALRPAGGPGIDGGAVWRFRRSDVELLGVVTGAGQR